MSATKPHQGIIDNNICNMRVANTGGAVVARLTLGGIDYHGKGTTVSAALADLDADIEGSANDCDCVLPAHTCEACCPKEVTREIFF